MVVARFDAGGSLDRDSAFRHRPVRGPLRPGSQRPRHTWRCSRAGLRLLGSEQRTETVHTPFGSQYSHPPQPLLARLTPDGTSIGASEWPRRRRSGRAGIRQHGRRGPQGWRFSRTGGSSSSRRRRRHRGNCRRSVAVTSWWRASIQTATLTRPSGEAMSWWSDPAPEHCHDARSSRMPAAAQRQVESLAGRAGTNRAASFGENRLVLGHR